MSCPRCSRPLARKASASPSAFYQNGQFCYLVVCGPCAQVLELPKGGERKQPRSDA